MNNSILEFGFPKSVQAMEKYAVLNYQIPEHEPGAFLAKCLADLPEFMALYLESDDGFQTHVMQKRHKLPDGNIFFMTQQKRDFLRANAKVREPSIYPLTKSELEQSKEFLGKHPELSDAIALTQACMADYFQKLSFRLLDLGYMNIRRVEKGGMNPFESKFYAFKKDVEGFSFLHDLLPIMGSSMAKNEINTITERDAGLALCDAFRLQAFKSHDPNNMVRRAPKFCPFSDMATKVFSLKVVSNNEGRMQILEGQKPGALLVSLMEYLADKKTRSANPSFEIAAH